MTQTTKVAPRTVNRNFAYDVVRGVGSWRLGRQAVVRHTTSTCVW
jgi:hypothetical protein